MRSTVAIGLLLATRAHAGEPRPPQGARIAVTPYTAPCVLPGSGPSTPFAPVAVEDGVVSIESEPQFKSVYKCDTPSGVDFRKERLLVYRASGDTATILSVARATQSKGALVLHIERTERCQGIPPAPALASVVVRAPRGPRAAVSVRTPPRPPCLAP